MSSTNGRSITLLDRLRATLAGPAAETLLLGAAVDWDLTHFGDFDEARRLLVCDLLRPHGRLIDSLADRLISTPRLSAREVAALCRAYERRNRS